MTTEGEGGVKTTNRSIAGRLGAVAFGITAMLTVGCTETEIQFVDREPFNPPPDAAAGFLGYYTPSDKQTTCGNCHIGVQTVWAASAHADAASARSPHPIFIGRIYHQEPHHEYRFFSTPRLRTVLRGLGRFGAA